MAFCQGKMVHMTICINPLLECLVLFEWPFIKKRVLTSTFKLRVNFMISCCVFFFLDSFRCQRSRGCDNPHSWSRWRHSTSSHRQHLRVPLHHGESSDDFIYRSSGMDGLDQWLLTFNDMRTRKIIIGLYEPLIYLTGFLDAIYGILLHFFTTMNTLAFQV